jgi:hypothetical protein
MSKNIAATAPEASAKGMRPEIAAKWGKFSTQEITDLKDKDDLVAQVRASTPDKAQAQRDVDAFAKGRARLSSTGHLRRRSRHMPGAALATKRAR